MNKNILGRIPVQIKSQKVKAMNNSLKLVQIPKGDFQNYLNEGGLLFINIEYLTNVKFKIFGKLILPKHTHLLKETKTKKVKLVLEEILNYMRLEAICNYFIEIQRDKHKQA